jgi:CRISPR-associated protein Cas5d
MAGVAHIIEVWGEFACFSRPETKTERFTYPVITPSAARSIFESILFKPSFYWQVERIELLALPSYLSVVRNEVKEKAPSAQTIHKWMTGKEEVRPILADGIKAITGNDGKGRTQRQTVMLRKPRYRLHGRMLIRPGGYADDPGKLDAMFQRRARAGQCFHQPYLGCREFVAFFEYLGTDNNALRPPVDYSESLGLMLYDIFDFTSTAAATAMPSFFKAELKSGVLEVPSYADPGVFKPAGRSG